MAPDLLRRVGCLQPTTARHDTTCRLFWPLLVGCKAAHPTACYGLLRLATACCNSRCQQSIHVYSRSTKAPVQIIYVNRRREAVIALACPVFAVALFAASPAASATVFTGKLWILPGSVAAEYPTPTATPDATFMTPHPALFSSAPSPSTRHAATVNNAVGTFLASANPVQSLSFSGLSNPAVGAPVSATTPVVNSNSEGCGTYSTYIEFTGTLRLIHDEFFYIGVDDGVSMKIDGSLVLTQTADGSTFYQFPGASGYHEIDLVYSNVCGGGWLSFGPSM